MRSFRFSKTPNKHQPTTEAENEIRASQWNTHTHTEHRSNGFFEGKMHITQTGTPPPLQDYEMGNICPIVLPFPAAVWKKGREREVLSQQQNQRPRGSKVFFLWPSSLFSPSIPTVLKYTAARKIMSHKKKWSRETTTTTRQVAETR